MKSRHTSHPIGRARRTLHPVFAVLAALAGLAAAGAPGCAGEAPPTPGEGERIDSAGQALTTATPVCVTLQRTLASGTIYDTGIASNGATSTNYGVSGTITIGLQGTAPVPRDALFKYDLSSIPPGAVVTAATATLWASPSAPATLAVHQATAAWNETQVTWASFNNAFIPTPFTTVSSGPTNPFNAAPTAPLPNKLTFALDALVQGWLSGAIPNDGVLVEQPMVAGQYTTFRSGEWPTVSLRPSLQVCYTVTCPAGFADCDGNPQNGCEKAVTTVSDCGACGNACALPNATPACAGGACAVSACNLGFGDCDGVAATGCETLLTTLTDCGACGHACALANASASCATGTCALSACNAGFFDCDGDAQNGCEALPCGTGGHCAGNAQCASGVCQNGICTAQASCSDGVQNGGETGVDCGGSCPPCGNGQGCQAGAGCQSGVCVAGVCQAASCADGVQNGGETAVDCGGSCPPCGVGLFCAVGAGCQSGVCTAGLCQAPACNDGLKNGGETDVDCGGGSCPACVDGQACGAGPDCVNKICVGGICQSATCTDGVQNGAETDVDCGGTCLPCSVAAHCHTSADCQSGVCVGGTCQAPNCTDGVQNGSETGVDCGGSCFKPEVCDGIDNDCNGLIDDNLGSVTCGVGACQRTMPACVGGQPTTCIPGVPGVEQCDGLLDEDCDGVVDNGCACVNGDTQSCYTGSAGTLGQGACAPGVQTCAHGAWGACVGQVLPSQEVCDGIDNDCNGFADDNLGQTSCGVGACIVTVANCVNGQAQQCLPGAPTTETCDGVDNDCDGTVDNNVPAITCGVGACQVTVAGCAAGQPATCTPGAPDVEVCDGVDNDCNGQVDEGNPGGGIACNTGAAGSCAAGTTACANGGIVCQQNAAAAPETCNGLDDDCDGVIDDNVAGAGLACATGLAGACGAGTTVCSGGQMLCNASAQPSAEVCDGIDNDCDGVIDNNVAGVGVPCSTGLAGACGAGVTACTGGGIVCVQSAQPAAEACDGIDNNCDGVVDEGCQCPTGLTQPCYTGPAATLGVGACHGGTQTCVAGHWGACAGERYPSVETCDGLDNDCNGQVDDGLGTVSCGVGQCANTVPACQGGHPATCTPLPAGVEICDGLDNNCDGQIDEGNPGGGAACATGGLGVCGAGATVCLAGALSCLQTMAPTAEVCDGLDNNCDGAIDEGNPGAGAACSTGLAGPCGAGTTACAGGAITCAQTVQPQAETCNGVDDNCNGSVDDGAAASCPAVTNGTPGCVGGACTVNCNAGFGNCDGNAANGCETSTSTSNSNCGTCGHACATGTTCSGGTCVAACLSGALDPVTGQRCPIKQSCTNYSDCGSQVTGKYWYCSPTTHVCEFLPQTPAGSGYTQASGSCTGNFVFRQDTGAPWDKKILPPDGVSFREGTTLTFEVTNTTATALYLDQIPVTLEMAGTSPSQFDPSSIKMYQVTTTGITDWGDGSNGAQYVCATAGPPTYSGPFAGGVNFVFGTGPGGGCGGSAFSRIPAGGTVKFIINLAFQASETYIANRDYRLAISTTTGVKARTSTAGAAAAYTACTVPTTLPVHGSWLKFRTQ
jgi:hypothetical protein